MLVCSPHCLLQEILPLAHQKPTLDPLLWGGDHLIQSTVCSAVLRHREVSANTQAGTPPVRSTFWGGARTTRARAWSLLHRLKERACSHRERTGTWWEQSRTEAFSPCPNCSQTMSLLSLWFIFYFLIKDLDTHLNWQIWGLTAPWLRCGNWPCSTGGSVKRVQIGSLTSPMWGQSHYSTVLPWPVIAPTWALPKYFALTGQIKTTSLPCPWFALCACVAQQKFAWITTAHQSSLTD